MSTTTRRRDADFREQPTLFGGDHDLVDHGRRARNSAFEKIAAELPERQRLWFRRIVDCGRRGVTLDELSVLTGQPPNQFSGRVTELRDRGLVARTKERRDTRAGSKASVIVARIFLDDEPELI